MEYSNVIMDDAHPISFLIGKQLDSSVPGGLVGDPNTAAVTSRENTLLNLVLNKRHHLEALGNKLIQ